MRGPNSNSENRYSNALVSNATFPSYFLKDEAAVIDGHARLDLAVFTKIAAALNITARYVGEAVSYTHLSL